MIHRPPPGRLYLWDIGEPPTLHVAGCPYLKVPFLEFGRYSMARLACRMARLDHPTVLGCPACGTARYVKTQ